MSKTMMKRSNKMMTIKQTIKRMRVRTILMTLIRIHAQLLMESGLVSTGLIQPTTTRLSMALYKAQVLRLEEESSPLETCQEMDQTT
jgi:hypothetical protein